MIEWLNGKAHLRKGLVVSGSTPVWVVVTHASSSLASIILYASVSGIGNAAVCKIVASAFLVQVQDGTPNIYIYFG